MEMSNDKLSDICSFYIVRKRRFCRMRTFKGSKFCAEHFAVEGNSECATNENTEARIPCPLDASHTCFISRLEMHMKKCNAREKDNPVYYQKHINCDLKSDVSLPKITLSGISDEELLAFLHRVHKVYEDCSPSLKMSCKKHRLLQKELKDESYGNSALKHLHQQASLISLMEDNFLLSDNVCYVEFGAGRGHLTYWIIQTLPHRYSCTFVLVDKASQRHKYDNKFKDEACLKIERIRIDIEHLCLRKIPSIASSNSKLVGVSKHLCGSATDMALKCLMETNCGGIESSSHCDKYLGILIASCCHHRCKWQSYVGKQFLQNYDFSVQDFQLMCAITSWATCGSRTKGDADLINTEANCSSKSVENINRYHRLNLSPEYRKEIGRKCKILLDMGRADYLKKKNFHVELVIYVESDVSLENIALLALPLTTAL